MMGIYDGPRIRASNEDLSFSRMVNGGFLEEGNTPMVLIIQGWIDQLLIDPAATLQVLS